MATGDPCPECGEPIPPWLGTVGKTRERKYCKPKCGGRARYRAWRLRQGWSPKKPAVAGDCGVCRRPAVEGSLYCGGRCQGLGNRRARMKKRWANLRRLRQRIGKFKLRIGRDSTDLEADIAARIADAWKVDRSPS